MSIFSPTSSDADVAPRLIWRVCESMMSQLFAGWLTCCRNWWWQPFSSQQFTLHLLVNRWKIKSFSRWLIIHRFQTHRSNDLTLQNEKATTTCEFNSRTVKSAQILRTSLDERLDASVHQPWDTQVWSLHINNCEAHSEFFALTPEIYGPHTAVFPQLASRGLERRTWPSRQRSVCEVLPTDMLGCSCIHQELDKLISSQFLCHRIPPQKFAEPCRLRVSLHQRGDRPRRGLRSSS